MNNKEQIFTGLMDALIGSVPVIFFIGVTTFAVDCANAEANQAPQATVEILDSEIEIFDATTVLD
jgi:hypothetical protein